MDWAFRRAVAQARRHGDLYFASLLSEDRILEAFGNARLLWQGWIYTPAVTVWVFLSQCLSQDHSCRDAVAGLIAWRLARGLRACSAQTGAYCTAREDLPEEACAQLMRDTGRQAEEEAPAQWLWLGHHVYDVDGSTFTMPDTPENQSEYPQVPAQRPGCGFPIARFVVVFSLAVGTVLNAALGKYQGKQTMAAAAARAGVEPWTISFKGALQTLNRLLPLLSGSLSTDTWCDALLDAIAAHVVGNRPDRFEPRVKKRRPKPYRKMTKPRHEYKRLVA